jgi:hypothetical protein
VQLLWKSAWRFLKTLKIELAKDPAVPLLGIYPKERNSSYNVGTCTPMVLAAIAKLWNQHRCPSADEWIKKMWYIYTMECYSP